jgi:predicted phosphodiesterase
MKIGILGDVHATSNAPEKRKDADYLRTILTKVEEAFSIFHYHKCDVVVQVGDIVDTPHVSHYVISEMVRLFRCASATYNFFPLLTVCGQHDIFSHSMQSVNRTPMAVLQSAGFVDILGTDMVDHMLFKGCSFGQEVPRIRLKSDEEPDFREAILVVHALIADKAEVDRFQPINPVQFLRLYPEYRFVICGDWHLPFDYRLGNRMIVNAGCIVRKTVAPEDMNRIPHVGILDTESPELPYEEIDLCVQPANEVFMSPEGERMKLPGPIQKFMEDLQAGRAKVTTKWKEILLNLYEQEDVEPAVREMIDQCMIKAETKDGRK